MIEYPRLFLKQPNEIYNENQSEVCINIRETIFYDRIKKTGYSQSILRYIDSIPIYSINELSFYLINFECSNNKWRHKKSIYNYFMKSYVVYLYEILNTLSFCCKDLSTQLKFFKEEYYINCLNKIKKIMISLNKDINSRNIESIEEIYEFNDLKKSSTKHVNNKNNCSYCNKEVTSFKKSHTIPQYILKNISSSTSENKNVEINNLSHYFNYYYFDKKKTGKSNTNVFFSLCDSCENILFKYYESPDTDYDLRLFENMSDKFKQEIMSSIAIKSDLYKKYHFDLEKGMFTDEHESYIKNIKFDKLIELTDKNINKHKVGRRFFPIFYIKLNYNVGFSSQESYIIDDVSNKETRCLNDFLYINIFPISKKETIVLVFCDEDNLLNYRNVLINFKCRTTEDILKYINYKILGCSHSIFFDQNLICKDNIYTEKTNLLVQSGSYIYFPNFLYLENFEYINENVIMYRDCVWSEKKLLEYFDVNKDTVTNLFDINKKDLN